MFVSCGVERALYGKAVLKKYSLLAFKLTALQLNQTDMLQASYRNHTHMSQRQPMLRLVRRQKRKVFEMDISLNAEVQCNDGKAGHVTHVILHPIKDELTHIIVHHHGQDYEVPVSWILDADSEIVRLDCWGKDIAKQPRFIDTEYIRAPVEVEDMAVTGYSLMGYYMPYVTTETYAVKHEHIPANELEFTRGTLVFTKEGRAGHVDELVVDPETYHITHIVLREGHLWGKKDVLIGVEHIQHIDNEGVHINLTKDEVAALPTFPIKRQFKPIPLP